MRKCHCRIQTVKMVNEYTFSRTCATCFTAMVSSKRVVNSKRKSSTSSSVCKNHMDPSYILQKQCKNHDVEAAKCLALEMMNILTPWNSSWPFTLRYHKPIQSHTGTQTPF